MHTVFLSKKLKYDGHQLAPLYNYLNHKILGDSIVGWRGACDVTFEHMMDGEDLNARAKIAGDDMLHFIGEFFHFPLLAAVTYQRMMGTLLTDLIQKKSGQQLDFTRRGDDIYWQGRKLNISIATAGANSSLIHFAVNVSNEGTPVATCSLSDFGISQAEDFAQDFLEVLKGEFLSIKRASVKVRTF